jgi:zinc/manganese transport system substrate-binding protein
VCAALAISSTLAAQGARTLSVVATTPDLGSLAREIGGTTVEVKVLAKPTEDPHFVDSRPSHIVTLNRADLLIDGGAELEMGWLPSLLESARNAKLASGNPGRISASRGIHLVELPTSFDRAKGDVHALGNPHFLMDPVNVKVVVTQIADHLSQINPAGAATYRANLATFTAALDARLVEWLRTLAPFKGAKIVTYHKDFVYFASRFGLDVIANLEPKPGIAPSPAHLATVIGAMQAQKARVIVAQPFQGRKTAETVARQTGATVVQVSQQPGAFKGTDTYLTMMDYIVNAIAQALEGAP